MTVDRSDQRAILETAASRIINPPAKAARLADLLDMHITRLGYRLTPIADRAPGEATVPRHEGQHPDCTVCGTASLADR